MGSASLVGWEYWNFAEIPRDAGCGTLGQARWVSILLVVATKVVLGQPAR
jgi:hypothetical protein